MYFEMIQFNECDLPMHYKLHQGVYVYERALEHQTNKVKDEEKHV
jgi:hypothetical protein